jgi:hypothetical protein
LLRFYRCLRIIPLLFASHFDCMHVHSAANDATIKAALLSVRQ